MRDKGQKRYFSFGLSFKCNHNSLEHMVQNTKIGRLIHMILTRNAVLNSSGFLAIGKHCWFAVGAMVGFCLLKNLAHFCIALAGISTCVSLLKSRQSWYWKSSRLLFWVSGKEKICIRLEDYFFVTCVTMCTQNDILRNSNNTDVILN